MLIATITVTLTVLALSFVQLQRWREDRNAASIRQDDIYFVPSLTVYPVLAILAIGSGVLVWMAAHLAAGSPYGWAYYASAVLCSGLCLTASVEARRTFIKIDGDEIVMQSLARRRSVQMDDIERVLMMRGAIVFRLRSGRAMIASNVLGWNAALRRRLDLLRLRRSGTD
jgi:hypothetical protein